MMQIHGFPVPRTTVVATAPRDLRDLTDLAAALCHDLRQLVTVYRGGVLKVLLMDGDTY